MPGRESGVRKGWHWKKINGTKNRLTAQRQEVLQEWGRLREDDPVGDGLALAVVEVDGQVGEFVPQMIKTSIGRRPGKE